MLIALCSDKGSPGTTTTAVTLASGWSTPAVVVEADPYGGDLGIRMRTASGQVLPETPTVLAVAAAARAERDGDTVLRYAQRINDQLSVVPGHLMAEQSAGIADWQPLADSLALTSAPVLVDLGRLHAASPMLTLAAAADVVVVVARADAASMIRLRERLIRLTPVLAARKQGPPVFFPVLVTTERHARADLKDLYALLDDIVAGPLIAGAGYLAWDVGGVERLYAGADPHGRLARWPLLRSSRRVVDDLTTVLAPHNDDDRVGPTPGEGSW